MLVEPEVARLAARHMTDEYAGRLSAASAAENQAAVPLPEDIGRKQAIHFILAEMCGNRFYESLVHSMLKLTREVVKVINPDPWDMHPGDWHLPVVEVVLRKDSEGAYEAMRFHAIKFGERLITLEKSFREEHAFRSPDIEARVIASQADKKRRPVSPLHFTLARLAKKSNSRGSSGVFATCIGGGKRIEFLYNPVKGPQEEI